MSKESRTIERIEEGDKVYLHKTMDVWIIEKVNDDSVMLRNTQDTQIRWYKTDAFKKDFYFKLKKDAKEE